MKKKTILIDSFAFLAFLISLMPDLTGLALHEWLGLAIAGVLLVHFLQHWQWVITVTQNLFHSKPKVWIKYLVDLVVGISFSAIILSGLVISTLLMLPLNNYETWRIVHVISSYLTLAILGFKVALHWDWLTLMINKCMSPTESKKVVIGERRKFLRTCFITGMAALFAVAEFKEWQAKSGTNLNSDDDLADKEAVNNDAFEQETGFADTMVDSTQQETETVYDPIGTATSQQDTIIELATNTPEPTLLPTATQEPTAVVGEVTGTVRCNRGCSYPGKCRRYQDTITKNNKCDLGEAIW